MKEEESHVLISNSGKDFLDGISPDRDAAFQRMLRNILKRDNTSTEISQDEKDDKKQEKLTRIAGWMMLSLFWENASSLDLNNDISSYQKLSAFYKETEKNFSERMAGYDLGHSDTGVHSIEDADRVIHSHMGYGLFGGSGRADWTSGSFKISPIKIDIGERQQRVSSAIQQASLVTGVPAGLAQGLWGVESSFGKNRLSPTGCTGDFQFTKSTFRSVINRHGDQIPGLEKALKSVNGDVAALRDHPEISAYAAQFYIKDLSEGLGLDVKDHSNWGTLYAAYNVGPGGVRKLLKLAEENPEAIAKDKLGFVAKVNPMFYVKGATASDALGNYQTAIETRLADYDRAFGKTPSTVLASAGTSITSRGHEAEASSELALETAAPALTPNGA